MGIVIGPILKRAGGYAFDPWTAGKGVSPGYPYRRIEDAHYARNATIKRASAAAAAAGGLNLPAPCSLVRQDLAQEPSAQN